MSERLNSATVVEKAIVHAELPKARVNTHGFFETQPMGLIEALSADPAERANIRQDVDRTFEMPGMLYGATVALYLGFIAMLGVGFFSPEHSCYLLGPQNPFSRILAGSWGTSNHPGKT